MTFGEKLNELMDEKKLSVLELSKRTGFERSLIYNYLQDKSSYHAKNPVSPRLITIFELCQALDYDIAKFLVEIEYASDKTVCLNDDEIDLLKLFRSIPKEKQEEALLSLENLSKK